MTKNEKSFTHEDLGYLGFHFWNEFDGYKRYSEVYKNIYHTISGSNGVYTISVVDTNKEIHIPSTLFHGSIDSIKELEMLLRMTNVK